MLEIQNVTFAYKAGPRVLDGISLELPREHVVAILGESGSGKTALLNCIGRFLRPQSGHILIDGVDMAISTKSRSVASLAPCSRALIFSRICL